MVNCIIIPFNCISKSHCIYNLVVLSRRDTSMAFLTIFNQRLVAQSGPFQSCRVSRLVARTMPALSSGKIVYASSGVWAACQNTRFPININPLVSRRIPYEIASTIFRHTQILESDASMNQHRETITMELSKGFGLNSDEIYSLLLDAKAAGHRLLSLSDAWHQ